AEVQVLDFPGVDVLPAANDHVLDAPNDGAVAVLAHHRQVPGVHPAVLVDGLAGLFLIVPVPEHDRVAAGAVLPGLAALHGLPGGRVDDLDFQVRVHAADGGGAPLHIVIVARLAGDRAGFGHPIGDGDSLHVH